MFSYERAIARVDRGGQVLGAAFLVTERHLLTCGHVVEVDNDVELVFLANPDLDPIPARVTALINEEGRDVAVLLLDESVPKTYPAPLAQWNQGRTFRATGFPHDRLEGDPVDGKLQGTTLLQQVKLEGTSDRKIVRQFSGTGVWSDDHEALIGMVVSFYDQEPTAYMIPTERIAEILEDEHLEISRHILRELSGSDAGSRGGWHISTVDVAEIQSALKGLKVKDDIAHKVFHEVSPYASFPVGPAGDKVFLDGMMTLARRPAEQLLTYILRSLALTAQAPTPRLRAVLEPIASRFALDLEKLAAASQPSTHGSIDNTPTVLQIRVAPGLLSDDECLIDAWLREGSTTKPLIETLELAVDQLCDRLPEIVRKAQRRLCNRRSDVQVEVALPLPLLGCDLDCWPVKFGSKKKALGACRQVCVRSYERLYDPEYTMTWPQWEEKWKAKPAGAAEPQHIFWDNGETDPAQSLGPSKSILVTLEPLSDDRLADFVSEGVPIALWLRTQLEADSEVRLKFREVLYENPIDGLPQRIREKRRYTHSDDRSLWRSVSLLWDSPDNLLPGALAGDDFLPLTAPEE